MKKEFSVTNSTANGKQTMHFIVVDIPTKEFEICMDAQTIRNLCKTGCVNYGKKWSCPPYSPEIKEIIKKNDYDSVVIITAYIHLVDMSYIKNPYQRVKAANMILKSKCEKYARTLEKQTGGYALLSGSCNLCKPCYKKRGLPCGKPDAKRYSLESTGVNVATLTARFCKHKLLWYKKGETLPYTSVVTAVLYSGENSFDFMDVFSGERAICENQN